MADIPPVLIVTGGSSGIGRETAILFAQNNLGSHIVLIARNNERLQATQKEIEQISAYCTTYSGDLRQVEFVESVFTDIRQKLPAVNFLVNNAGSSVISKGLFETSMDAWSESLAVNIDAAFLCAKLAAQIMTERQAPGSIVNVSSIAAYIGTPRVSYTVAKTGMIGLTRSLSCTLAPHGIRINAVAPGAIDTPLTAHWDEAQRRDICKHIPLGRIGTAKEVAEVILFLLSDKASYITGQTININGGWHME